MVVASPQMSPRTQSPSPATRRQGTNKVQPFQRQQKTQKSGKATGSGFGSSNLKKAPSKSTGMGFGASNLRRQSAGLSSGMGFSASNLRSSPTAPSSPVSNPSSPASGGKGGKLPSSGGTTLGLGINAKGDIDFGASVGGVGAAVSSQGDVSLGLGIVSVTWDFQNPNESALGFGFNTFTIEGEQEGCTIILNYKILGQVVNREYRQADNCSTPEPEPQPNPGSVTNPPSPDPAPGQSSTSRSSQSYKYPTPVRIRIYKSGFGQYYDNKKEEYYFTSGAINYIYLNWIIAGRFTEFTITNLQTTTIREGYNTQGRLVYWSRRVYNYFTITVPWDNLEGFIEVKFDEISLFKERVINPSTGVTIETFSEESLNFKAEPILPVISRYQTQNRTIEMENNSDQAMLIERIYEMLGGDLFYEEGLAVPNELFTPEADGNSTQIKTYNEGVNLLFRTIDHRTPAQVSFPLPNGAEYSSINAQGYFADLGKNVSELLEKTNSSGKADNAEVIGYMHRVSLINTQIFNLLIKINELVKGIVGFLGIPMRESVEVVDIPFDPGLKGKLNKGFAQTQDLDKELEKLLKEQNASEDGIKETIARYASSGKIPVRVKKLRQSKEGGDFWWLIRNALNLKK